MNNQIPYSAWNWNFLGDCSSQGLNEEGHEPTTGMYEPGVIYNGNSSTQATFEGSASDPLSLWAFPISWNAPLTLTEISPTDLNITGTLTATCYPAHEVSVGGTDLNGGTWMPTSNNLVATITPCLAGFTPVNQPISQDIVLGALTGPLP